MTDLTYRQKEALSSQPRMNIYTYLQNGIEPASAAEVVSALDLKHDVVIYDLRVLVDAELAERIPAEKAGQSDCFKAVEVA